MSRGRDARDDNLAKTKLLKSVGQRLIPCKVSKWWYPVAYVHLKETHIDGKVKIAFTKRDRSKAKLFNRVNIQADLKNDTKMVNVWLGFACVNNILQSNQSQYQSPVHTIKQSIHQTIQTIHSYHAIQVHNIPSIKVPNPYKQTIYSMIQRSSQIQGPRITHLTIDTVIYPPNASKVSSR